MSASPPTLLLAGGGTGGHVAPALATAAALRALDPAVRIEFVGSARGQEAAMVPEAGWTLHLVEAAPLRGVGVRRLAAVPAVVGRAAWQVRRLARARGAVGACAYGGYTSVPLALGARLAGVPLVVHEQNAVPGLANRLAALWAAAVAVSVPGSERRFRPRRRVTVTGNPVRPELAGHARAERRRAAARAFGLDETRATLLVFGGSQGARRLNEAVLASAGRWPDPERLQVLHVSGRREHARVAAAWEAAARGPLLVRCEPFVARMELAYALADVALCRAGASTIAELCATGLPALLVPYPHAAADEQSANARALAAAGAAVVVADGDLDADTLVGALAPLLADRRRLEAMGRAARALARPHAAAALARLLLEVAGRRLPGDGGPAREDGGR